MHLQPEEASCLHQLLGQPKVLFAGTRIATGVIVHQDDPSCGLQKGFTEDIAGVDKARIEGPFGDHDLLDQAVSPVKEEGFKDLFPQIPEQREIIVGDIGGSLEGWSLRISFRLNSSDKLKGSRKDRGLGRSDPFHLHQFGRRPRGQPLDRLETTKKLSGQIDGRLVLSPFPEQDAQELRVRKVLGTVLEQSLPGSLFPRPPFNRLKRFGHIGSEVEKKLVWFFLRPFRTGPGPVSFQTFRIADHHKEGNLSR
jgi:hypothetical protein